SWQQLKLSLPTVPVHDLVVKDNDLVVGTHGRSIWIFDNLTPIWAMTPAIAEKDVHLFPVQEAIRYLYSFGSLGAEGEPNPPAGAVIDYYLKKKPAAELKLEILDAQGKVINTMRSKSESKEGAGTAEGGRRRRRDSETLLATDPGINRVVWDLNYGGPKRIAGAMAWPGAPAQGPLALPGKYTLKLTTGGKSLTTALVVRPDPRVHVASEALEEQLKLALEIR